MNFTISGWAERELKFVEDDFNIGEMTCHVNPYSSDVIQTDHMCLFYTDKKQDNMRLVKPCDPT